MSNTANLIVHTLVKRKEDTPPQLACFLTANSLPTGHTTVVCYTLVSPPSPHIPTTNMMCCDVPLTGKAMLLEPIVLWQMEQHLQLGKKQSHAAKTLIIPLSWKYSATVTATCKFVM